MHTFTSWMNSFVALVNYNYVPWLSKAMYTFGPKKEVLRIKSLMTSTENLTFRGRFWSKKWEKDMKASGRLFFFFFFKHSPFYLSFFFLAESHRIKTLVPRPGIKPMLPAVEAQSLNHWTTRAVPVIDSWLRKIASNSEGLSCLCKFYHTYMEYSKALPQ